MPQKSLDEIFSAKPAATAAPAPAAGASSAKPLSEIFSSKSPASAAKPDNGPKGIIGTIGKAVLDPFLQIAASLKSLINDTAALGKAGIQYVRGDKAGAQQTIQAANAASEKLNAQGEPAGNLGNIKPVGAAYEKPGQAMQPVGDFAKGVIGTGIQTAIRTVPIGEAVAPGLGATIKAGKIIPSVLGGAVSGGTYGLAEGLGQGLAQGTPPEQAIGTARGYAEGGALFGGLSAGILASVMKVSNGVGNIWQKWRLAEAQKNVEQKVGDQLIGPMPQSRPELAVIKTAKNGGIGSGDIGLVRNATPQELKVFDAMQQTATENVGTRAPITRPVDKAGDVILKQIDVVDQIRKAAGESLDEAVQAMPDGPVDITGVRQSLMGELSDQGVAVRSDGTLDFRNSRYSTDKGIQTELNNIWNNLRPNAQGQVLRDPSRIITLRRGLFDLLSGPQRDLLTPVDSILTGVREDLNAPLIEMGGGDNGAYATASRTYAQTRQLLTDFYRTLGYKYVEGQSPVASLRVGEVMSRMLGNSSAQYVDLLLRLQDTLDSNGFQTTVSPMNLLRFNSLLEDIYGSTQPSALAGRVQQGIQGAVRPVMAAAQGNFGRAAGEVAIKLFGGSSEAARGALRELLNFYLSAVR
jgi:hypothetical protein